MEDKKPKLRNGRLPANFKTPAKPKAGAAPSIVDVPSDGEEATYEDEVKARAGSKAKVNQVIDTSKAEVPSKIDMRSPSTRVKHIVPSHVFRCSPFKFSPSTWVTESESLNNKFVDPAMQIESLQRFLRNPRTKMIYGVAGNPDDSLAKYFAAYLVGEHIKALGVKANVIWHTLYGGFDNPLLKDTDTEPPTMLVLTNLTPNSTNIKLEKARDILEKYSDIPRIVVSAGMDPLSFLATKLYVPVHGVLYLADSIVRQKIQVI